MADGTFASELFGSFRTAQGDQLSRALALADAAMKQREEEHQKEMDKWRQQYESEQLKQQAQYHKDLIAERGAATKEREQAKALDITRMLLPLVPPNVATAALQKTDPETAQAILQGGYPAWRDYMQGQAPPPSAPAGIPPSGTSLPPIPQVGGVPMPPTPSVQPTPMPSPGGAISGGMAGAVRPAMPTPAPSANLPQVPPTPYGTRMAEPTSVPSPAPPATPDLSYQAYLGSLPIAALEKIEAAQAAQQARLMTARASEARARNDTFRTQVLGPQGLEIRQQIADATTSKAKVYEAAYKDKLGPFANSAAHLKAMEGIAGSRLEFDKQKEADLERFRQITGAATTMRAKASMMSVQMRAQQIAKKDEATAIWKKLDSSAMQAERMADGLEKSLARDKAALAQATLNASDAQIKMDAETDDTKKLALAKVAVEAENVKKVLQERIGDPKSGLEARAAEARRTADYYRNISSQMANQLSQRGWKQYTDGKGAGPVTKPPKTGSTTDITDILSERYTIRK